MVLRSLEDKLFFIKRLNPWHNFIYISLVIAITMFSLNPIIVAISLVASLVYLVYLRGVRAAIELRWGLAIIIITTLVNPLISHNGATILFYINNNRITLEALMRGAVAGGVVSAVIFWFAISSSLYNSERFMAMFAKRAPKISLLISMILKFIPDFRRNFASIHEAGSFLGKKDASFIDRVIKSSEEYSTLVSLSMEDAIDTANSMAARGYASGKRTSVRRTYWNIESVISILFTSAMGSSLIYSEATMRLRTIYYPYFVMPTDSNIYYILFFAIVLIPSVLKLIGDIKWNLSMSRI